MNRIKVLFLCLVLLAVAGIVHHEWLGKSGESLLATPTHAAVLSNGSVRRVTARAAGTRQQPNRRLL